MRTVYTLILFLVWGTAAQAQTVVRFTDARDEIVFVARGEDIEISGDHKNILIQGSAHRVTVDGHHHDLVISDAAEIVLDGHHLDVKVERVGAIVLNGHHNDVVVTDCQPAVTYGGEKNQVISSMGTVEGGDSGLNTTNVEVAEDGQELTLSGAGRNETLNVDGRDVVIEGSGNRFTLLGRPTSVTVTGALNQVDIEETAAIVVNGAQNVVSYKAGRPRIDNSGLDNQVNGP